MVPQNLYVQNQLNDNFSARVQLGFNQFADTFVFAIVLCGPFPHSLVQLKFSDWLTLCKSLFW